MPEGATALEEAAMRWAVRAESGGLSAAEEAKLEAWIGADVRHAGAFARAMAASAYLDRSSALGQDYTPAEAVAEVGPSSRRWHARITRRAAITAGFGTALAATVLGVVGVSLRPRGTQLATQKGDMRRVALADGSSVTLNTETDVRVALERDARTIALVTGEAIFDVAHDPRRPFTVTAGETHVRAIGTSFIVRLLDAGDVLVTVREGVVGVTRSGEPARRVPAGGQVLVSRAAAMQVRDLSATALAQIDSWQQGRIDLTDATLGTAAAEFARYSNYRIVIDDPAIARMKVAGIYTTTDPRGFAEAAALSLGLKAIVAPETVRIVRAPSA